MSVTSTKHITLDVNNKFLQTIKAKQGDASSRYVTATLVDGSIPINLVGATASVFFKKPDGNIVYNSCNIVDAARGVLMFELTSQTLVVSGRIAAEITLYDTDPSVLSTIPFEVDVVKTIRDDDSIESSNEFTALTQAVADITEVKAGIGEINSTLSALTPAATIYSDESISSNIIKITITGARSAVEIYEKPIHVRMVRSNGSSSSVSVQVYGGSGVAGDVFILNTFPLYMLPPGGTAYSSNISPNAYAADQVLELRFTATGAYASAVGNLQFATTAEVQAGTISNKAVTPAGLLQTGTWQPSCFGSSSSGSWSYTMRNGKYIRIGKLVFCAAAIIARQTSIGAGEFSITHPGIAPSDDGICTGSIGYTNGGNGQYMRQAAYIQVFSDRITVRVRGTNSQVGASDVVALGTTEFTIQFSCWYFTA